LGDWGRALGFAIALIYFGAMDSALFDGRTIGKRIVGVKVVTSTGVPLSLGASMLRATIFCVPYFLNGAFIDAGAITSWLLVFLIFGVGISIVYLLLFNRRTRQSLHDLAAGAYVVSKKAGGPIGDSGRIWPVHFGVVGLILIAALVLPYFAQRLASSDQFAGLLSAQQGLQQEPGVRHATASIGVNKFVSNSKGATTTHIFSSRVFLSRRVTDFDSLANRLARIILDRDSSATNQDVIEISIVYGYDIGIASAWRSKNFAFSPSEWRKREHD
jgi:RDD family